MKILRFCYNIFVHLKGQTHVQTFQAQILGATMQFGSKSGCGAILKVWTWIWDLDLGMIIFTFYSAWDVNIVIWGVGRC